ncbi:phospholipase/carboxylesterase family protein [Xylaria palmicola]|nr:phospholipase/carboxylesterase family protein [Xylaria palmicola]
MDFPTITTDPAPPHNHTHTVVFLHGRGDRATSFADALTRWRDSRDRSLAEAFPTFRFVFPQAPTRKIAAAPESQGCPQWFDVWNVRDFAVHEDLQVSGLREVVPAMRALLAAEAARLGGRWDRVVLAGISMGAATGAHLLFNLDRPLGAFMGFCGRCPFAGRSLAQMREVLGLPDVPAHDAVLRETPVLLEHCVHDPLVLVQNGRQLRDTLLGFGAEVTWREYSEGGHWFKSPEGMDDVVAFLEAYVLKKTGEGGDGDVRMGRRGIGRHVESAVDFGRKMANYCSFK